MAKSSKDNNSDTNIGPVTVARVRYGKSRPFREVLPLKLDIEWLARTQSSIRSFDADPGLRDFMLSLLDPYHCALFATYEETTPQLKRAAWVLGIQLVRTHRLFPADLRHPMRAERANPQLIAARHRSIMESPALDHAMVEMPMEKQGNRPRKIHVDNGTDFRPLNSRRRGR